MGGDLPETCALGSSLHGDPTQSGARGQLPAANPSREERGGTAAPGDPNARSKEAALPAGLRGLEPRGLLLSLPQKDRGLEGGKQRPGGGEAVGG